MRCYICDNDLEFIEMVIKEGPLCDECNEAIEEAIERDEIEENNDNRLV